MDDMYFSKASFIILELNSMVKRIDSRIVKLEAIPNTERNDVIAVGVYYRDGSSFVVNVECDSLSAIAIDVIKSIH